MMGASVGDELLFIVRTATLKTYVGLRLLWSRLVELMVEYEFLLRRLAISYGGAICPAPDTKIEQEK